MLQGRFSDLCVFVRAMKDKGGKQGSGNNHGGITIITWIISFTVIFCNTEETFNEWYRERSDQVLYPPHQLELQLRSVYF